VAARELGGEPGRPARARARSAVAGPGTGRVLASGRRRGARPAAEEGLAGRARASDGAGERKQPAARRASSQRGRSGSSRRRGWRFVRPTDVLSMALVL